MRNLWSESMKNLALRTISGIIFTAILVFALIWNGLLFAVFFLFVLYYGLKEFYQISLGNKYTMSKALAIIASAGAFVLICGYCFYGWEIKHICYVLIPLLLIPFASLIENDQEGIAELGLIYTGLVYIALPICLSPFMMIDGDFFNGTKMLSLFILMGSSDVGAYCLGTLFGQKPNSRKLAPKISPKKSWWGVWSGLIASMGVSVALHYLNWLPFALFHCVAIGAIVSIGGVAGDLFESLWKRRYGVKDSGKIIPGHGGILDRFDSSLVAIPLAAIYMSIMGLL